VRVFVVSFVVKLFFYAARVELPRLFALSVVEY
jgi:hypothetical protein